MPTPADLLSLLANRGTCSAEDLCRELACPVGGVLKMVHDLWWEVSVIAGPTGWLYRIRQCVHERAWACRVTASEKLW